jgi:hypothetical protein
VIERGDSGREVVERRVAQMTLIEIFRPGRMGDRGQPLAAEIRLRDPKSADHALGGHSRDDRRGQDRNQRDAGQHP